MDQIAPAGGKTPEKSEVNTDRSSQQRKQVARKYMIRKNSQNQDAISINLFNEQMGSEERNTSMMTNTAGFANLNLVTVGQGRNKRMRV